jgi:hypothetical protein
LTKTRCCDKKITYIQYFGSSFGREIKEIGKIGGINSKGS